MSDAEVKKASLTKEGKATNKGTSELAKVVYFKSGNTDAQLLEYDKAGADIRFDLKDFREIPDDVLLQCSPKVNRDYNKSLGALEVLGLKQKHEVKTGKPFNLNGDLGYVFENVEPGWYHTRVRAADKSTFEAKGYEYVKDAHTVNGKVTMVEMRVNEDDFQATIRRDAQKSGEALKAKETEWDDRLREHKGSVRNYKPTE